MDENATVSSQPTQSQGNTPPQQNVGAQGAQSVQGTQSVQQNPSLQPSQDNPRITLTDLYGPSVPSQPQQNVVQQPSQPLGGQPQISSIQQPSQVPSSTPLGVSSMHEIPHDERSAAYTVPPSQPVEPVIPQQTIPVVQYETQNVQEKEPLSDGSSGKGRFHLPSLLRFVVIGIVLVLFLLILWGIGSFIFSNKSGGNGKVTLQYWGLWEDPNVMQPILSDFQKEHPNITVTYTKQDPKNYVPRLLTRMKDGSGPDIFRLHNSWVYPLQSVLLPLPTNVIDAKIIQTNYPPVVGNDVIHDGAIYGLPLQMDTLSLFVNTDIFTHAGANVPVTWDNFITVAKALTVKDPSGHIQTAGAALGTYENITHAPDIMSILFMQNGADMQKLANSQNASDALTFYTSFAKPPGNVWDATLDTSLQAFAKGKLAMYFGYSYDIFAIKQMNPNLAFTTHPVPHLPGREATVASYWIEGVSNKSSHPKEAILLMQYLAKKDTLQRLYSQEAKTRQFGELYPRTDLAKELAVDTILDGFISQYAKAQSSIFAGDTYYSEYNDSLNRYLGNAINSMLKDTSADSAMAALAQGVAQITSQYAPKSK